MTVKQFPIFNLYNIPEALRKLANDIEDGKRPALRVLIAIELEGGVVDYAAFGKDFYWLQAVGLCEAVKGKVVRQMGDSS